MESTPVGSTTMLCVSIFLVFINLSSSYVIPGTGSRGQKLLLDHAQNWRILDDLWLFPFASTLTAWEYDIYQILFFQICAINGRNVTYIPEIKTSVAFLWTNIIIPSNVRYSSWCFMNEFAWGKDGNKKRLVHQCCHIFCWVYLSLHIFSPKFSAKIDTLS